MRKSKAVIFLFLFAALLLLGGCASYAPQLPSIQYSPESRRLTASGLSEGALMRFALLDPAGRQAAFHVRVAGSAGAADSQIDAPPLAGEYWLAGNQIVFHPREPLRPGVTYLAAVDGAALAQPEAETSLLFVTPLDSGAPVTPVTRP